MKHLMILRHAKTVSPQGMSADHERPLTPAGHAQARALGELVSRWNFAPQRIVCSGALRARETAEELIAGGKLEPPRSLPLEADDTLYNAPGETLLRRLQALPDDAERVMVVAHLPGVAELTSMLTTEHLDLALLYQPCTLSIVVMDEPRWSDLDYGVGALALLLPPMGGPG